MRAEKFCRCEQQDKQMKRRRGKMRGRETLWLWLCGLSWQGVASRGGEGEVWRHPLLASTCISGAAEASAE